MTMVQDGAAPVAGEDVVIECSLDAPPQKVWRALTVPTLVAAWLMPGEVDATPGARFDFDGEASGLPGPIECRVLAAEPHRLLRYSWRERDGERTIDSVVTFELDADGRGGTRLRIVHGDFVATPLAANTNIPAMMMLAA
ncbi:SRPBCC family protein [Labrys monachus]|uniref:Uncharacterized protein YndB with AHSA1/START domain n=1 Tax=Labrys monachus TaxID=217067 RepID=A0ABU0FB35_9HYPH|nr:SRPBCC domain-containing protein [Labrys monachus]MDQ0391651.1 uncharacterized protein YndB with AHSA1/START domain [Labrys monachus]